MTILSVVLCIVGLFIVYIAIETAVRIGFNRYIVGQLPKTEVEVARERKHYLSTWFGKIRRSFDKIIKKQSKVISDQFHEQMKKEKNEG
ncbi:MAG TPA: hypothetical protein VNQ57_02740 [Ureibacillus sp.]|nr:hypothetical protein [Ureibacillus sp.]